jgi:hypothetical protein
MAPGPSEQFFSEFVSKYWQLILATSLVGVISMAKKVGSCLRKALSAFLGGYKRLNREFYETRAECAENKLRFQKKTERGNQTSY